MRFRRQDTRYRAEREKLGNMIMVDETNGRARALPLLTDRSRPVDEIDWGNDSDGAVNLARCILAHEFSAAVGSAYGRALHEKRVRHLDREQWQLTGTDIEKALAEATIEDPELLADLPPADLAATAERLQAYWPSGWLAQFARARLEALSRNTSFRPLVRMIHADLERLGDPALDRIERAAVHANGQETMGSLSDFLEYHTEMLQVLTELTDPKES